MGMELTNNNNKLPLEPDFSDMSDPNVVIERRTTYGDRTTDLTLPSLDVFQDDQSRSKNKSKKRRRRRSFYTPSSFKPASPDFR